jgi:hypothetical protein
MVVITKRASSFLALAGVLVPLCAIAVAACSQSSGSGSPGDASADALVEAGPPPPLGVPVASCTGCPVCGGVLGSPTTGLTYCTQDCTTNADCPNGTGCSVNAQTSQLPNECLATCTTNADCVSPFICRSDLGGPGNFCWSPYPPPVDAGPAVPEAGPDASPDASDTDSSASEAGPADAGATVTDASDAAPDGG